MSDLNENEIMVAIKEILEVISEEGDKVRPNWEKIQCLRRLLSLYYADIERLNKSMRG